MCNGNGKEMKTRYCSRCDKWLTVEWKVTFCAICGMVLQQSREDQVVSQYEDDRLDWYKAASQYRK